MKVNVYVKSLSAPLQVELKDGVKMTGSRTTEGQPITGLLAIGETENGPAYVQFDDLVAIIPAE